MRWFTPTHFMCLRHVSVWAPYEHVLVRADRCPLPDDVVPHGDEEAGPDEDGVPNPRTWDEAVVDGYEGPSVEEIEATLARERQLAARLQSTSRRRS